MHITSIRVRNFRSLLDLTIPCSELVAVCGPNSSGKSNLLRALKFAFLESHSIDRIRENFSIQATGPRTTLAIHLRFDKPTKQIAKLLGIPEEAKFEYTITATKGGAITAKINSSHIDEEKRIEFCRSTILVDVPAIRDLAAGGLGPFRSALGKVLKKTRGDKSFSSLASEIQSIIEGKGKSLLESTPELSRTLHQVDEISIDTALLDFDSLLEATSLKVKVGGSYLGLDKLGTGHQSSVIIQLFRQLGKETDSFVLYLFEEPDNHLHPCSMSASAVEFKACANEDDAQVFLTSHSPHLLNQFDFHQVVSLGTDKLSRTTLRAQSIIFSDREIRITLGKFGLKPIEALLADKIILVEGPMDVTVLSTIIELYKSKRADQLDIVIIPCGGKEPLKDLAHFLLQLGVKPICVFDRDAAYVSSKPLFDHQAYEGDITSLIHNIESIKLGLDRSGPRKGKPEKILDSMVQELQSRPPLNRGGFNDSILDKLIKLNRLLTHTKQTHLKRYIERKQVKNTSDLLRTIDVILWRDSIEDCILHNGNTPAHVASILKREGKITHSSTPSKTELKRRLHKLANEPTLIANVIRDTWDKNLYKRSEFKTALATIFKSS